MKFLLISVLICARYDLQTGRMVQDSTQYSA